MSLLQLGTKIFRTKVYLHVENLWKHWFLWICSGNSVGQPWFLVKITYLAKGSVSLFGEARFELLQGDRNACGQFFWGSIMSVSCRVVRSLTTPWTQFLVKTHPYFFCHHHLIWQIFEQSHDNVINDTSYLSVSIHIYSYLSIFMNIYSEIYPYVFVCIPSILPNLGGFETSEWSPQDLSGSATWDVLAGNGFSPTEV